MQLKGESVSQGNQLEQWLALEREVGGRIEAGAGCGVARPEQVAGKSGLEVMQAMLRGELPYPPIARTLSFQLLEVESGRAVFQGRPGPDHLNPMGGIHGGWYATLLDSALGCAVHTMMPPGRGSTDTAWILVSVCVETSYPEIRKPAPERTIFQSRICMRYASFCHCCGGRSAHPIRRSS